MHSLNMVVIAGNVTRNPEIRFTPQGLPVAAFGLAINQRWKDRRTDEWREESTFVEVRLSGQQAEFAEERVRKGRPVHIEGRLQMDQWEDKRTGQRRERLRVLGQQVSLLARSKPRQKTMDAEFESAALAAL